MFTFEVDSWQRGDEQDIRLEDAMRIAQVIANTEGVEVTVVRDGRSIAIVQDGAKPTPHITLAERVQVTATQTLRDMLEDARRRALTADDDTDTITDELVRRAR